MPRPHVTSAGAGCSTADVVRLSRERTHPTVVSPPLNATPLRAQRRRQVRILQDASTEASRLWAAAVARGHDDKAAMYEERAMALAAGAAALEKEGERDG
jgi:hypothetical protein